MPLGNKLIGQIFTVSNRLHHYFGRTFKIVRFGADKFGGQYAICDEVNKNDYSSYIFYKKELIG